LLDQRPLGMKLQTVCRNLIGSRLKGIGETAVQPSHRSPGTAHCHSRSDVVVFLIGMRDPFGDCGFRATPGEVRRPPLRCSDDFPRPRPDAFVRRLPA
jgi:hypothetical protein